MLGGRFLADYAEMGPSWADWATDIVTAWPDDPHAAEPDWPEYAEIAERESKPAERAAPVASGSPPPPGGPGRVGSVVEPVRIGAAR